MNDLMTTLEAAEYLSLPPGTLRSWRHTGVGPRSFNLGAKQVRYQKADVDAWLEAQYRDTQVGDPIPAAAR